ncbi:MAG: UDP-N-acetylmuramate dehydrogenase [candidate division WOR-3 bacterium]
MNRTKEKFIKEINLLKGAEKKLRGIIKRDEPLAQHTTFQIGGNARYFIIVDDYDSLKEAIRLALENYLPYFIIGMGSNLLISDQGFPGMVIKLGKDFAKVEVENDKIICGAGVKLKDLVTTALAHNLTGAEFLFGIPGTFGGAVKNNAGAFTHSISEIIESVQGIQINHQFEIQERKLSKDQIGFGYRSSQLPPDFIITQGILRLRHGNRAEILSELERIKQQRKRTQPFGASAGSIFKNPKDNLAGKLLDEVGLKGFKIGGAYVSNRHANFIINQGGAKFNDVLELIQIMKLRVEMKTNIILEEEIEIIPKKGGEFNGKK